MNVWHHALLPGLIPSWIPVEFSVSLSPKLMQLMMIVLFSTSYIIVELHEIFYLKGIRGSGSQPLLLPSQKLSISHNKKPVYAATQPSE